MNFIVSDGVSVTDAEKFAMLTEIQAPPYPSLGLPSNPILAKHWRVIDSITLTEISVDHIILSYAKRLIT